jgi:hypothetical protein
MASLGIRCLANVQAFPRPGKECALHCAAWARARRPRRPPPLARPLALPAAAPPLRKYVVARFWPDFARRPESSASLRGRGSSLACRPSFWRICSARSPFELCRKRPTMFSTTCAISSAERRGNRPPRRRTGREGAPSADARCGVGWTRPDDSPSKSSSDAPRMASSTKDANDEARSLRRWRSDMGEDIAANCKLGQHVFVLESRPSGRSGGMADAADSKSAALKGVRVRVPPSVPQFTRGLDPDPSS